MYDLGKIAQVVKEMTEYTFWDYVKEDGICP